MITIQESAAIVRARARRMVATVVTTDLPADAVSAFARRTDGQAFLVVDTDKPNAWHHAREMLLDMPVDGPEERTAFVTADPGPGRKWLFYRDSNLLAFAPELDEDGRVSAIAEASVHYDVR